MNYWFLYSLIDGSIYGGPYLGPAIEWTNIPNGCGVLGPFDEETAPNEAIQAFLDPMSYKIIGGKFVYEQYIPPEQEPQPPSMEERMSSMEDIIMMLLA